MNSSSSPAGHVTRGQTMMSKARQAGMLRGRLTTPAAPLAQSPPAVRVRAAERVASPVMVARSGGASMSVGGPAGRLMQTFEDRVKSLENPIKPLPTRTKPRLAAATPVPRLNAADLSLSSPGYITKTRAEVEKEKGDAVLRDAFKRKAGEPSTSIKIKRTKRAPPALSPSATSPPAVAASSSSVADERAFGLIAARMTASSPLPISRASAVSTRRTIPLDEQHTGPTIFMPKRRQRA